MGSSDFLFQEANKHIPGGVNSPVRAFTAVGGSPVFIKKASGQFLFDTDGKRYLDFIGSWGPMILGHAHPTVLKAVEEAIGNSFSFGTPTEIETAMAVLIKDMVPGIEKVRMLNSGTEACMSAVRLARGATGKNKIIKFIGCYHGHADSFLKQAGSGVSTLNLQDSPGVPKALSDLTLSAIFNDITSVQEQVTMHVGEIAAIIVEPVAGNMGCIPPKPGFLKGLRQMCDKDNILLIFDEVMSGFRIAGGGAVEKYGVQPDILTMGKIIGGGLPVGAYAAKAALMDMIAPEGDIYQAGTLSGNPLAMAAGYATLTTLDENPEIYQRLERNGAYLENGMNKLSVELNIPLQVNRVGSMISVHFCQNAVVDFESAWKGDNERFKKFFHGMLNQGIYLPPSPYETWFISCEHTIQDLDFTLESARIVLNGDI